MRALDDQVRLGKVLYPASLGLGGMGRSRKPTPPLGCVTGHRSPRSSCGTTCLTVPRSGNCCPWPTRLTWPVFAWGPLCRRTAHRQIPQRPHRPSDRGWKALHPCRQRRHRPRRRRHLPRNRLLTRAGGHFLAAGAARLGHPADRGPHRGNSSATTSRHRRAPQPAAPGPPRRTQPSTLGFPRMSCGRPPSSGGIYGAQLPDIDDPRAQAVRRTTTGNLSSSCPRVSLGGDGAKPFTRWPASLARAAPRTRTSPGPSSARCP